MELIKASDSEVSIRINRREARDLMRDAEFLNHTNLGCSDACDNLYRLLEMVYGVPRVSEG